ncbi:hypothetical protein Xsto_01102 [Xenorhabdus stockiae]|uniref:Uncharacterized protein n=1 Tax=Xenorhabdus stockiae TaxID=351614 RepID=A0A2D0KT46_9GAMM|nr:hypothetical protein Xekk_00390 [Xenorhabdus sp. KK7.4]PHM66495.1 hypothetical protein Xsto_01102 [Xenorhabdus stockiae]PHM71697.1 hypothetical protein Xekj_00927 [Xenorhabdus sp. KJ12.1]
MMLIRVVKELIFFNQVGGILQQSSEKKHRNCGA